MINNIALSELKRQASACIQMTFEHIYYKIINFLQIVRKNNLNAAKTIHFELFATFLQAPSDFCLQFPSTFCFKIGEISKNLLHSQNRRT